MIQQYVQILLSVQIIWSTTSSKFSEKFLETLPSWLRPPPRLLCRFFLRRFRWFPTIPAATAELCRKAVSSPGKIAWSLQRNSLRFTLRHGPGCIILVTISLGPMPKSSGKSSALFPAFLTTMAQASKLASPATYTGLGFLWRRAPMKTMRRENISNSHLIPLVNRILTLGRAKRRLSAATFL